MRFPALIILALAGICSCKTPRYSYVPSRINTPLLKEKNELQLDASLNPTPGLNTSIAFAPINHLGVMFNCGWSRDREHGRSARELLKPFFIKYTRRYAEAAVGYFVPIGNSNELMAEIYGGLGKGYLQIRDTGVLKDTVFYGRHYRSHISRFFIQPAIGYNGKSLQLSLFMRFLYLKFKKIETNYSSSELDYYDVPSPATGTIPIFEAGTTWRFYFSPAYRLGLEFSIVICTSRHSIDIVPIQISGGLHYRLQRSK